MRRMFQGRTGMTLAFILGLTIATAGTAAAAKLITGRQIKDGTISTKDLSRAVRAQLRKAGVRGPVGRAGPAGRDGAPGSKGDPGPLLDVLPSGRTVRGVYDVGETAAGASGSPSEDSVSFPVPMPAVLTAHFIADGGTPPAACAGGTVVAPRADPGHLCVFEKAATNHVAMSDGNIFDPTSSLGAQSATTGFGISVTGMTPSLIFYSRGSWAATAQ